jgi:cell division septum initiation protein DivIVA
MNKVEKNTYTFLDEIEETKKEIQEIVKELSTGLIFLTIQFMTIALLLMFLFK